MLFVLKNVQVNLFRVYCCRFDFIILLFLKRTLETEQEAQIGNA